MSVAPRNTPAERDTERIDVEVDEDLTVLAATLEDWATARPGWEYELREGHEFGRSNNVEVRMLYVEGAQTSSLLFRLDQLDAADDTGQQLMLRFEEREGIAKLATLSANGLDVELHHILTYT
ncbi:MAG TPA: hypothetical protein VFL66_01975 [Gaiellaceae bacterium]|nr:hypothetical protein [Gaiellaceae bacterium]